MEIVRDKKFKKRLMMIIIASTVICAGLISFKNYQMGKIPGLSFEEALAYTTCNNKDAVITVGIIKDGKAEFTVYGENGKELPKELHCYEIGSITKTITAALISRAIEGGKIDLDNTIDAYLPLPEHKNYPTVEQLLTHTSGYKSHYLELPMISNFFAGRNGFCGITKEMLEKRISNIDLGSEGYKFKYSNFGFAVLGLILEKVYGEDYTALANSYLHDELQLADTKISDGVGDLGHYWDWQKGDAYIPAGAVVSDISDMLAYAQLQMDEIGYLKQCHKGLKEINGSAEKYKKMGIYTNEAGMAWIIDTEHGIIWHNGGTSDYNSYLGFYPYSQTAVVILSNLAPDYRIPSTVLGVKLLRSLQE